MAVCGELAEAGAWLLSLFLKSQLRIWHSWGKPLEHSPCPSAFPTAPRGRQHPCQGQAHGASSGGMGNGAMHTRTRDKKKSENGVPSSTLVGLCFPSRPEPQSDQPRSKTASRLPAGAACGQACCQMQTLNVGAQWTFSREHLDPTVLRTGSQRTGAAAGPMADAFGQTQSPAPGTVSPGLRPACLPGLPRSGNTASLTAVPMVRSLPRRSLSPPN